MNAFIFALALHVLAVVVWIGGMSMVTVVLLPAVRRGALGNDRVRAFEAIKGRFVWIARAAVLVVGVTGFYLVARFDSWSRRTATPKALLDRGQRVHMVLPALALVTITGAVAGSHGSVP